MQLDAHTHFFRIIIPGWQDYLRAEDRLSAAIASGDAGGIEEAGYEALRRGGDASTTLHHFTEVVLDRRPAFLPPTIGKAPALRQWLTMECYHLRTGRLVDDVHLLGDVADSLKHTKLRNHARQVASRDQVLAVGTGFGVLPYGEGKFGGTNEVILNTRNRPRALAAVLQNVVDAWRRGMGVALPALNEP